MLTWHSFKFSEKEMSLDTHTQKSSQSSIYLPLWRSGPRSFSKRRRRRRRRRFSLSRIRIPLLFLIPETDSSDRVEIATWKGSFQFVPNLEFRICLLVSIIMMLQLCFCRRQLGRRVKWKDISLKSKLRSESGAFGEKLDIDRVQIDDKVVNLWIII